MPRRLISKAENRRLSELTEACFVLEGDLERREALSAQYDSAERLAEEVAQLNTVKAELRALLETLLQRLT
jgi:hypothetical protein